MNLLNILVDSQCFICKFNVLSGKVKKNCPRIILQTIFKTLNTVFLIIHVKREHCIFQINTFESTVMFSGIIAFSAINNKPPSNQGI